MTAWTTSTTATTPSRAYAGGGASLLPRVERAARPSAGTRLTRRGRVVVVLGLLALLLAAFSVGQARSDASTTSTSGAASTPVQTTAQNAVQTTVHQGDTLWSVARRIAPDNDPREVVVQIRRLNEMTGSTLQVGQQLLVPYAA